MPRTPDEQLALDRIARTYRLVQSDFMLAIERAVCGCDYGGTSWTTRQQADEVIELLGLGPHRRLLELGAGSGWPGLYIAKRTGCDIALIDLPHEGLRVARSRAASERIAGACWVAAADGAALPLRDSWADAISHSDLLCCLVEKLSVLMACRRVVRAGGMMAFSVIYIPQGLSSAEFQRAKTGGPPFPEADASYPELLARAGWAVGKRRDLTSEYLVSMRQYVRGQQEHWNRFVEAFGIDEATTTLSRRRATVTALEEGLLRRELFLAVPQDG